MQKNAYVPVGVLVGLAIGYFLFRDDHSTLTSFSLALVFAIVGGTIGYFFAKGTNNRP